MIKSMTSAKRVRFRSNPRKDQFMNTLRERVDAYFAEKGISQYADTEMYLKTVLSAAMWLASIGVVLSGVLDPYPGWLIVMYTVWGFVNVFIAFNIMHDATHDAYSGNPKVNKIMGYSMDFIGGNQYLFRRMHGAHHGYVNIHGIDVTMESHGMFRFTPAEPWKPFHRFQHIYTFVLYSLAMFHWVMVKDFKWMFGETHIGNQKNIQHPTREKVILLIGKTWYFGTALALPLLLTSAPVWAVLTGFVSMHILPGLYFALIFQVTHVYEGTTYPLPDDRGDIHNNYALHVLETTADFSRRSRFGSWLMGGINIHVIHHIFPRVCHTHYPALTDILAETAEEFGLEYQENERFIPALKKHYGMLKHLSKEDAYVPTIGKSAMYA